MRSPGLILFLAFCSLSSRQIFGVFVIHEAKDIVKKVLAHPRQLTLSATTGIHKPIIRYDLDPSSVVHLARDPRSQNTLTYVPPTFITGTHLLQRKASTLVPSGNQLKSRYWAFSTTYDPSTSLKTVNLMKKPHHTPVYDKQHTSESKRNLFLSDQALHPDVLRVDENNEDDEDLTDDEPTEIFKKYRVVLSPQTEETVPTISEPIIHRNSWRENNSRHDSDTNWGTNNFGNRNSPNYYNDYKDKYTYVPQISDGELQQQEPTEKPREVHRSSVPWGRRIVETQGPPRHVACNQPLSRGDGPDEVSSWYYDEKDGRCRWFGYRGYGGNGNRFYSRSACEGLCIGDIQNLCELVTCLWPATTCTLVGDQSCKDYKRQRDKSWETDCPPDQPVCITRRNTRMAPDIDFQKVPSECLQEPDGGSCQKKNPSVHFYYDRARNDCMAFYFHECGGNDNRFVTKSDCMTHCSP